MNSIYSSTDDRQRFSVAQNAKDGGKRLMEDYYARVLIPFVDRLIRANYKDTPDGYSLNFDSLSSYDKQLFVVHLLENDDRDLHSIYDNQNYDDIVCQLIELLKNSNLDSKIDFSDVVRHSMVKFYEPKMQHLLNERIKQVEQEDYEYFGLTKKRFPNTDEFYWSRA